MGASSSPSTTTNFSPTQAKINNQLYRQISPNLSGGVDPYQGQQVAPLDSNYQNVLGMLSNYNPNQYSGGQQQALNQALSGKSAATLDPTTTANYFQQAVVNPSMANYQQNIAPQISQAFAGMGGTFSSARGAAQAKALSNLQMTNAAGLAQAQMQNQQLGAQYANDAANRQLSAVGASQQASVQPLLDAQQYATTLTPFQTNAQQQASAQYNEWLRTQPYNSPYLSLAQQYLGQSSQSAYQKPDYTGQYIGAGTGLAGAIIGAYFGGPGGALTGGAAGYGTGSGTYKTLKSSTINNDGSVYLEGDRVD